MISDELAFQIEKHFGHVPTDEQREALRLFASFMADRDDHVAMILRGAAGTGKTTLAAAIVRGLLALKQKMVLMAPTGRAAKVFSNYAGHPAYTIHRRIYRQRTAGDLSSFNLNDNLHTDTLFIVDEASMIANGSSATTTFGSGNLLDDLIKFVYNGRNCRLLLIGDKAQLPPVGESLSPALSADVLSAYGLTVYEADLNEVLRQAQASGILFNATRLRRIVGNAYERCKNTVVGNASERCKNTVVGNASERCENTVVGNASERCENTVVGNASERCSSLARLEACPTTAAALPKIAISFPDITLVPGDELIEQLASSYSHAGLDDTIVITRSNKRANIYNQGIRRTILDREDELCRGDLLMIAKNNYSLTPSPSPRVEGSIYIQGQKSNDWQGQKVTTPLSNRRGAGGEAPSFLANGDRCVVQRVRNRRDMHGFRFADATLLFPDYDDYELTATVILDTLTAEAPALTGEQQQRLFDSVMADYADIPLKADRIKALRQDPYYNALQVKFGYAVTCHKAQGGQWQHVYIDQGYIPDDTTPDDYLRWLYTAITRATDHLFLVNWPQGQTVNI